MSVNIEFALITKVVDSQDFATLGKMNINETYFSSPEVQECYRFLRDTYHNPGTVGQIPSREMVQYRFPGFQFFPSNDSVGILATQLRQEKLRIELLTIGQNIQLMADSDPIAAIAELVGEVSKLKGMSEISSDMSMADAHDILLSNYESVQSSGGMLGIPFPWEFLNEDTQGMQPGQFIILYGRPGSMKSWLGIDIGVNAYVRSRRRVLFYTREMSKLLVMQRVAARIAKVDHAQFKRGRLQPEMKEYVFSILKDLANAEKAASIVGERKPYFMVVHDSGGGSVSWLHSKIKEYEPDLVIVDGLYLMKDDRSGSRQVDWKAIAHISQDLKLTAGQFNIPIIGITQANRGADKGKGDDLTELSFSDSLGQDSDAVFRVSKKDIVENGVERTELYITSPKLREGKFHGFVLGAHPATHFDFLRVILNTDTEKDDLEPPKKSPGRPSFMDPKIPIKKR